MFRSHKTTLLVIILLHAFWFAAGMSWRHFYNGDSYEYIYLAESIGQGHYYGANPELPVIDYRQSSRTPAYPAFLLLFYSLFGKSNVAVLVCQNLLSILSCIMILQAFKRIDGGKQHRWLYLLFLAFYPAQQFFASTIAPDTLLQFFLTLYCCQLLTALKEYKPPRIFWMSLWLILATLTKPVVYPLLVLHFAFALWLAFRNRSLTVVLSGLLPLLLISGYGLWNKERTGLFHISSIQSNNLLHYNAKLFLAQQKGLPYADSMVQAARERMENLPGLKAKYEYASGQASAIIRADLPGYIWFHARESARYFVDPGKSELDLFTGHLGYNFDPKGPSFYKSYRERGIAGGWDYLKSYPWLPLVLLVFLFNLLRIVGMILFVSNRSIPLSVRVVISLYILYFAAVTGPVANTRYFLPVLLMMSAASAVGITGFLNNFRNRKKQALS